MITYYQARELGFSASSSNSFSAKNLKAKSGQNNLSIIEMEKIWNSNKLKNIPVENNKFFDLEFFAHFYAKSDKVVQSKLLFYYTKYSGHQFNSSYKEFLEFLDFSNDNIVYLLKNVHTETCSLKGFNLKEFNSFLLGCKMGASDRKDLIFDFIKLRRKEIKDPALAPVIRDFLIESHNESDLKRYFVFFPFLHAHFKDRKIDCFENIAKISTSTVFIPAKMVDSFCVDSYKSDNYLIQMRLLSQGLKLHYGFISESVQPGMAGKYVNTYLHNNPEFTQDKLIHIITSFFEAIRENVHTNAFTMQNIDHIDSWLRKYDLEHQLDIKPEVRKQFKI